MKQSSFTDQPTRQKPMIGKDAPKLPLKQMVYITLGMAVVLGLVMVFRPAPILVDSARIERGSLQVTVNAEGKTRIRQRYVISAPVNGHLDRITLNEGDLIERGTIVARIDPLPLNASVTEALSRLAEYRAEKAGVETKRPKPESLTQAQERIQAAQANQRQAEAKVSQAQAFLNQARRDRQRAQELERTGAISRRERENAELSETTRLKALEAAILQAKASAAEVAAAQAGLAVLQKQQKDPDYLLRVYDARIASTEAELSTLRDEAARTPIRAPVRGRVLRILQKSAQFVTDGTPLLEMGDPSKLEIVVDALSSDAVKVKPGDPMLIDPGAGNPVFHGRVRVIEPSGFTKVSALGVEEQRVNIIGDFVGPSKPLGDGYRVETRIITWEGKNVLKVPMNALFRCDRSWCVFVVKEDKAQRRQIDLGYRSDLEAEVRKGLIPSEVVILHPTEQIEEGKQVKLTGES
ncbi:MAG: HlyD family efflux transporter periplasmic adaptor subunit [Kovacikia sp.]